MARTEKNEKPNMTLEEQKEAALLRKTVSRRRRQRFAATVFAIILFVSVVASVLQIGAVYAGNHWEFWSPDYEMTDISPLLEKEKLTEKEYDTLYHQTGLTKIAIDDMRDTAEGRGKILNTQTFLFREHEMYTDHFGPFTYMEWLKTDSLDDYATIADLKDGDILVSSTMRFSWWRFGHSALVVDGENGLIIEAVSPGTKSAYNTADSFSYRGDFIVLRPKVSDEIKQQVIEYAKENLVGIPYQITTGIFSKKYTGEAPTASQCTHLVWYAYRKFGIDLDSNKGALAIPRDIFRSDKVETVQVFGFDLDNVWQ